MKNLFLFFLLTISLDALSQTEKAPGLDKSPLDLSYYPANYGYLKIQGKAPAQPVLRVIYSRPYKNGRTIFGGLIKYGEVWRLGANEATEIDFFRDVKIDNKPVPKGRYTMYAIPYPDKWTIILNKETDTWGAFKYDSTKDIIRVSVPVTKNETTENLTLYFAKSPSGTDMIVLWDDVKASLPINF